MKKLHVYLEVEKYKHRYFWELYLDVDGYDHLHEYNVKIINGLPIFVIGATEKVILGKSVVYVDIDSSLQSLYDGLRDKNWEVKITGEDLEAYNEELEEYGRL